MSSEEVTVRKGMFRPDVGTTTLAGFPADLPYPRLRGNRCSIADGPHLANLWSENLAEWARRNPDVEAIEVTTVSQPGCELGLVTDGRLADWRHDRTLCIIGTTIPSDEMFQVMHALLGIEDGGLHR